MVNSSGKHINRWRAYGVMGILTRFNPITGMMFGVIIGGIIGTYAQRYFGLSLALGAVVGLLVGQWSRNKRKS